MLTPKTVAPTDGGVKRLVLSSGARNDNNGDALYDALDFSIGISATAAARYVSYRRT